MNHDPVVIVGAARTPLGRFQGALGSLNAPELGAVAIRAAVRRAGLRPEAIEEVYMGCVLPAGLGQAPARQASLAAGLPLSTPCTTVNKVCGSGMKAAMLACDGLLAGSFGVAVAGGMESMSNAPYLLPKARGGYRLGHGQVLDHMFCDGLEDAYEKGRLMGAYAEDLAEEYGFSREQQDDFALRSLARARKTVEDGGFSAEIAAVAFKTPAGDKVVERDETPFSVDPDKIPYLKPAFSKKGTVTAANASSIADGAAALVLMRLAEARRRGLEPLAAIRGHATHAQRLFTTAPAGAVRMLTERLGWGMETVDLFEINEAFAVVALAAMRDLNLPHAKLNVHGGACALGHPIGATGARIVVTLLAALQRYGLKRGIAALCLGGGEATALAVERL